jgi:hypothetical protein
MSATGTLLADMKEIRRRARPHLTAGTVTQSYGGNVALQVSTTRVLLERILAPEEEHANDMHDLPVSHEGRPMLEK